MAKSGTVDFYNGVGTKSLRFDIARATSLVRTPAAAGNRRTWTWSAWFKRSQLTSTTQMLFSTSQNAPDEFNILILDGDDRMSVGTAAGALITTTMKFRDFSAWYHVVARMDTTQATAVNRFKLYINGVETANDTNGVASIISSQDQELGINKAEAHHIGKRQNNSLYFGGYMSDINFVDGTSLGPDSFGEFKNSTWIPIVPDVTYGTNGYRLDFVDNAVDAPESEGTEDTDNIGSDSSGEHNNWTSSGIVASDCAMPDTPENNFCTMGSSSMRRYGHTNVATMTEGNLLATIGGSTAHAFGTMSIKQILANSLGVYFEMRCVTDGTPRCYFGIVAGQENNQATAADIALYAYPLKFVIDVRGYINGGTQTDGTNETNIGAGALSGDYSSIFTVAAGDVMGLAIKSDGKVFISKNGTFVDSLAGTSNPATGANPIHVIDTTLDWFPIIGYRDSAWHANFGQDGSFSGSETSGGETDSNGIGDFFSAVPSGFVCLSTLNMAEPTIGPNADTQADDHFNIVPYTGSGSSPNAITGVGFQPDWVWIKKRAADASHAMFDSSRGVTAEGAANKAIGVNRIDVEGNGNGGLSAFGSDGFTLVDGSSGSGPRALVNDSATYVAWNWKANGGTATATISESGDNPAAVVQANPTAGFSLITYTGTGDAGTIAHGLGAVPKMMMIKNRDVNRAWAVYHGANTAAPATDYLVPNTTAATADAATYWADTAPTSSVFTVHDANSVNEDAKKYVAYVFAEVEGYSKFGSYTGNGSADGTFVYTGFRPAYVMFKITNTTGDWNIYDSARSTSNIVALKLRGTASGAEITSSDDFDILSNGFKLRDAGAGLNGSGNTYIYMAFAEAPFKYANAR